MTERPTAGRRQAGGQAAGGQAAGERAAARQPAEQRVEQEEASPATAGAGGEWPLWEVFVRSRRGLSHGHTGSLHAPDAAMALRNARDLYTRRAEGVSIWVVPSSAITASSPDEKDPFFASAADKPYRHPTFYEIPEGVKHL
jgi:ring-1,2-phenylacetyl-CoA epoxidase subunit PaaB